MFCGNEWPPLARSVNSPTYSVFFNLAIVGVPDFYRLYVLSLCLLQSQVVHAFSQFVANARMACVYTQIRKASSVGRQTLTVFCDKSRILLAKRSCCFPPKQSVVASARVLSPRLPIDTSMVRFPRGTNDSFPSK